MKLKIFLLFALSVFVLSLAINNHQYHPPTSPSELVLDSLLAKSRDIGEESAALHDYITKAPDANQEYDKEFDTLITSQLRNSIARMQIDEVKKNCNGKYIEGELCGLDVDPITCSQDSPVKYVYRSKSISPHEVVIHVRADYNGKEDMASYRLAWRDPVWKVDGIRCGGGSYFTANYPSNNDK